MDADGNLKDGVEGGKPLSLMSDKEKEVHESKVCRNYGVEVETWLSKFVADVVSLDQGKGECSG